MNKLDRSRLKPNAGHVWQEITDPEYLQLVKANLILGGATRTVYHGQDGRGNPKLVYHAPVPAPYIGSLEPMMQPCLSMHSVCGGESWWVHIVYYDEFVEYIQAQDSALSRGEVA